MAKITPIARIAVSLSSFCVSILFVAYSLQMVPDGQQAVLDGRRSLCETIAINFSLLAERDDQQGMQTALAAVQRRNPEIESVGVRDAAGQLVIEAGEHQRHWSRNAVTSSSEDEMQVPISRGGKLWGTIEVRFKPLHTATWYQHPVLLLAIFVGALTLLVFYFYLRKVLKMLNPSRVIPNRVRSALDTLAEGLLVLDNHGRIVLANEAFISHVGADENELVGRNANELSWSATLDDEVGHSGVNSTSPWSDVIEKGQPQSGRLLRFTRQDQSSRTFVVNAVPVRDDEGTARGVVTSFEDITPLEEKKAELASMLETVRASADRIRRQNEELERLATRDPLTGCFNRRSFLEKFDAAWNHAQRSGDVLSCLMVDVDHFKQVNDNHGHSAGDEVLKGVGQTLLQAVRESDTVCRYGGEEFSILLPNTTIDEAQLLAERIRRQIADAEFANLKITASLGISATNLGAENPQLLLDEADRCLYAAKRSGRNRVIRSDEIPEDFEIRTQEPTDRNAMRQQALEDTTIPFPAVTALISALAYRDPETAEHSRRVADLCVAVAEGLMSLSQCYALETAALLHDIGKIGVPDSILLKPGRLTEQEWSTMRKHERMGAEIIRASFASETVSQIIELHHRAQGALREGSPIGLRQQPLGARILTIADAYDAMTTDRVYRKGRSREEAYAELRRCADSQFDPELVERFIAITSKHVPNRVTVSDVSKDTALNIGMQLERLIAAVDRQDAEGLRAIAEHLSATAQHNGAVEIADAANDVVSGLEDGADLLQILKDANELLDICRATQASFLQNDLAEVADRAHRAAMP